MISHHDLQLLQAGGREKFQVAKNLLLAAQERPYEFAPQWKEILSLVQSDNAIIQWTGIDLIASCAPELSAKQSERCLQELLGLLENPTLITTNHIIVALESFARSKPSLQSQLLPILLSLDQKHFETSECRNIVIGKVIESLPTFASKPSARKSILRFLKTHSNNRRPATAKKAVNLLKKLEKMSLTDKSH